MDLPILIEPPKVRSSELSKESLNAMQGVCRLLSNCNRRANPSWARGSIVYNSIKGYILKFFSIVNLLILLEVLYLSNHP